MKNEIYDSMLSRYDMSTEQNKRNAIFEVNQQVILAGLYNGGFFDSAAFYGGTCLRIFHGLQRFSEDMDSSLLAPDDGFDFSKYFQPIVDAFALVGREVEIKKKDKKNFGKVESAFLKDNTDVYDVMFQTEKSIKIKIEVDTCPPLKFMTEQNIEISAAVLDSSAEIYFKHDFKEKSAIVFGSEAIGVSKEISAAAKKIFIPMSGAAESLNVSTAAGIVISEIARQRNC